MRRIQPILLFVTVLLILPCRGYSQTMADKVPGDALVTVGWRGTDNLGPEFANSNLKGTLDAVRVQALLNQYLPMLVDLISQKDVQAGTSTKLLLDVMPAILRHPTAFCFRGMSQAMGDAPPLPLIYLVCQSGDQTDALNTQLHALIDSLPNKVPGLTVTKGDGQITLQVGTALPPGPIAVPLKAVPAFNTAMAQLQKDPILWSYVDTPGMLKLISTSVDTYAPPEFRPMWPKLRAALGVDGFGAVASTAGFDGKDWQTQSFMAITGHTGLLSLADPRPVSDDMLNLIPKAATTASAFRMDLAKLFTLIHDVTTQTDANAGNKFDMAMKAAQATAGVDLEKGLIDTFGDEWVVFGTEFHGSTLLGQTVVNKMRDAKTASQSLAALETVCQKLITDNADKMPPGQTIAINHVKGGDIDVTVVTVQNQQICLAINGDYFYAAPDPGMITSAVNHITAKDDSILKNETFLAVRKHLNVTDALTVRYADLPTTVPEMLTTLRGMLVMAKMAGINIPADLIPTNESLQPFLTPAIGESWMDKDGWHMKSVGPFPGAG